MKLILSLFVASLLFILSCKKNSTSGNFQNTAVITGEDLTMCACCGGYMITTNGKSYEFDNFPPGCSIDSTHFPISVQINWHSKISCSSVPHIVIDAIQKVN